MALVLEATDKDALKETANVCAGQAINSLSNMLQEKILLSLSDVDITKDTSWASTMEQAMGVCKRLVGDMEGSLVITLKEEDARWLATTVQAENAPGEPGSDTRVEHLGGLIADAYLEALAQFVGLNLQEGGTDMITSPIQDILEKFLPEGGVIVRLKTGFIVGEQGVEGSMFFLLTEESANSLLKTINAKF
jgi:chemotaxis protein CheY-P-specific phosphatase CheC